MKNNNQTPLSEKKIAELINREAIKRVIEQNRKFAEAVEKLKKQALEHDKSDERYKECGYEFKLIVDEIFGSFAEGEE